MSEKEIDVRVTATTQGLESGMDKAADVVRDKTGQINRIMKENAEKAAAIARKQAQEVEDIAKKQADAVAAAHKAGADKMSDIARSVQNTIVGMFSIAAIVKFVSSTKDAVTEAEAAFRGLESVANFAGVGIGKAMQEAGKLAADGLMTTAEASKALQNLLSRGYSLDQAVATLDRLKDAAAYNRAAHLSMGEAVVSASEGLKNENSILVDNAGVTKNVSKMWEEYAATIGKGVNQLTQAEKIQAEYNGVMAETEAQVGNAAKASDGLQGKSAKLSSTILNLKVSIGEALTPAFEMLAEIATWVIGKFDTFVRIIQISGAQIGKWGADVGAVFNAVSNWDFSNLRSQLASNAEVMRDMVDGIMTAKPGSSFQASGDSGKRRDPNALNAGGDSKGKKSGSSSSKEQGPIDVFDNGSFITSSKEASAFIKQQFDAVNDLQRDMVKEADKAAKDMAAAQKKSAEDRTRVEWLYTQNAAAARMAVVDASQSAADQEYSLGIITKQQLLAMDEQFEQERNLIRLDALNQRLLQLDPERDPVAYAQVLVAIEELERQHYANIGEIRQQAVLTQVGPMQTMMQSIEQGMTSLGTTMLTNWRNVGATLKSVLANIGQTIIQETIVKPLVAKAAAWAKEKLFTMAGIGADAAKAGSGAAASQASIPYIGPILAIAAMAAVFAGVMGMSSKVPSAAGGFDIPSGMNPLTQLHEEEMVLPKNLANNVRKMTGDNGGEQKSVTNYVTMEINTPDADSFRANSDQMTAELHQRLADLTRGV